MKLHLPFSEGYLTKRSRGHQKPLNDQQDRRTLGHFWLETVKKTESPVISKLPLGLSAAERLEQLQEAVENRESPRRNSLAGEHASGSATIPYRRSGSDTVASRRAQYINETFRSQSPMIGTTGRGTPIPASFRSPTPVTHAGTPQPNENGGTNGTRPGPNFAGLDNAIAEINPNGCGKFPTGDLRQYNSQLTVRKTNFFGGRMSPTFFGTPSSTLGVRPQQHSPSPDTLSDVSQQSLSLLPHPRPKHNVREQLLNAGVTTYGSYSSKSSSPNFPAPSKGGVASKVSAFENRPGTPNLLQLACVLNGSPGTSGERSPGGPKSPRATVYRTKPVIHVDMDVKPGGTAVQKASNTELAGAGSSSVFDFPSSAKGKQVSGACDHH
ncbi:EF hand family protein [Aphelenchoides avenae]|nr:EF hand family protein [Aphelenchus avenae]